MKNRKQKMTGGGATDYAQSFHAYATSPAQLSKFTLNYINQSPMFNPLSTNTIIPTGTSGIIPTGAYYNSMASLNITNPIGPPTPGLIQMGGSNVLYVTDSGKKITNRWIAHVHKFAKAKGLTYSQALKDSRVKIGYKSKSK